MLCFSSHLSRQMTLPTAHHGEVRKVSSSNENSRSHNSCGFLYGITWRCKSHENKLDWFDDDWKWDVLPTRMLYELLLSPTYRWPWKVKIVCSYRWGAEFPKCPRCGTTMEREYQLFCNHCGQRLNWSGFDDVEVRYIGWDWDEEAED